MSMQGGGIDTHPTVKTQQRNATTGVRIGQLNAVDRCRHAMFFAVCNGRLGSSRQLKRAFSSALSGSTSVLYVPSPLGV